MERVRESKKQILPFAFIPFADIVINKRSFYLLSVLLARSSLNKNFKGGLNE